MSHDYTSQNTTEDPRMIAFFDYLVQQEIEGFNLSSSHSSDHSSENSSRPGSPTSDTEPTTHFNVRPLLSRHRGEFQILLNKREKYIITCLVPIETRRGETSQRHINRIAYLIATKRKSLKRLALRRNSRTTRRMKNKYVLRPTKRAVHNLRALNRKPYDKKMRRLSVQSKYKKPVSHELTSDSEVPQKIKRRRTQSYTVTSRSFRRKVTTPLSSASNTSTRVADKSDSSSDYDDDDDDGFGVAGSFASNVKTVKTPVVLDMNIPSTSTGITSNGKGFHFRIANNQNDSDDDQSIPDTNQHSNDNQLRVLRSPPIHNGTNPHRHEIRPNGKKKHHHEEDSSSNLVEDYASSNSNSLVSSTEEDSHDSNDSYASYTYGKKQKLLNIADDNGNESNNNNSHGFNNNNSFNAVNNNFTNGAGSSTSSIFGTPGINRIKMTPDSGISRGSLYSSIATPSPSSSRGGGGVGGCSNDIQSKRELIKRNIRKNIQTSDDDSD